MGLPGSAISFDSRSGAGSDIRRVGKFVVVLPAVKHKTKRIVGRGLGLQVESHHANLEHATNNLDVILRGIGQHHSVGWLDFTNWPEKVGVGCSIAPGNVRRQDLKEIHAPWLGWQGDAVSAKRQRIRT
jgi:hypothetical protein